MRRIDALRHSEARDTTSMSFQQFADWMAFEGHRYMLTGSRPDMPDPNFAGYIEGIHKRNGVVAAAVAARALLISQLRFTYRNNALSTTPGRTFSDRSLGPLEHPGATTRVNMLHLAEEDASYAGNWYVARTRAGHLNRLRPDWVTVALGSDTDPTYDGSHYTPPSDAQVIGVMYTPTGGGKKGKTEIFLPGEYAHWMPEPDPINWWRGQSWVTSVMREIAMDGQILDHQSKFFENAATPNLVFMMDPAKTPDQVKEFRDVLNEAHVGLGNRFKNLFLGGGTDVKVVGSNIGDLGLHDLQGGFESRVATRSRVPAVVLGIREGMGGSALNAGNYSQTRRLWSDGWFTPTVHGLCEALEGAVKPPADADLWYDASQVLFLQEDLKDSADIQNAQSQAMRQLIDSGFDPKTVVAAVTSNDMTLLEHTGLVSVQLQAPGSTPATPAA